MHEAYVLKLWLTELAAVTTSVIVVVYLATIVVEKVLEYSTVT